MALMKHHQILIQMAGHDPDVLKVTPLVAGEAEIDYFVRARRNLGRVQEDSRRGLGIGRRFDETLADLTSELSDGGLARRSLQ